MILLIDNYDSFTFNLYQQASRLGAEVKIIKNDAYTLEQIKILAPEKIILSPGPKTPRSAGECIPIIHSFYKSTPILGICLGHQCLAVASGKGVQQAKRLLYGKTSPITQQNSRIMKGLPERFEVARYHSLVIDGVPDGFLGTSYDAAGDIMSIEHQHYPVFGVQFHPESFLMEPLGDQIIKNFLAC